MSPVQLRALAVDEPFAVVITTKNRHAYLCALLASLLNQTRQSWHLAINDQSDSAIESHETVSDLLSLLRARGHPITVMRTTEPRDRYQRVLDAVPPSIELVHRIDDDVVLSADYLEKVMRPFFLFPKRPIAAVGGCLPGPAMRPLRLGFALSQPGWFPRIDRPTWRLQGHSYHEQEILDMESLWGSAMCYRRSATDAVGGWAVPGHSPQVFREDSDMSARLVVAGYELMMSTEALGWHLVAPSGGAREVTRTPEGNVYGSHREDFDADDALFRRRLEALLTDGYHREDFGRYRVADLEAGRHRARALVGPGQAVYRAVITWIPLGLRRRIRQLLAR